MESGDSNWEDRAAANTTEERRYVQLAPETVINAAESIGIGGLSAAAAKALAEDTTFRLRDIADLCSQLLRHSRKRTLTTDQFNRALRLKSTPPVIGHKKPRGSPDGGLEFRYVPEAEVYVSSDAEINLVAESLQPSAVPQEQQIAVHASWLALQGMAMPVISEDTKVLPPLVPPQSCMTPALLQYYAVLTRHVLGDSEQLCRVVLQDVRQNQRLTALLPYLVTFIRVCMNRYKEKPGINIRLIRLISALFSNPHINLAPKPYLSYLVSTLLSSIILERRDKSAPPVLDHVDLAAGVLSHALQRWATPVNQLRLQTLKALKEYCCLPSDGQVSYSQYGALSALCVLGPTVLEEVLFPHLEGHISAVAGTLPGASQRDKKICLQILNLIKLAGNLLLCHWLLEERPNDWPKICQVYRILYSSFGDALLCRASYPRTKQDTSAHIATRKPVLRRILIKTNPVQRQESMDFYPDSRPRAGPGAAAMFADSQNFDYFADMGVPSDIFEPCDEAVDKQEQDYSSYFKSRVLSTSPLVGRLFPDSRPMVCRPRALRLKLGPCRQLEPDKYAQKRPAAAAPGSGKRSVPWRHFAVGRRYDDLERRRRFRRLNLVPDYVDILLCA